LKAGWHEKRCRPPPTDQGVTIAGPDGCDRCPMGKDLVSMRDVRRS
jgi:hypothetical protein